MFEWLRELGMLELIRQSAESTNSLPVAQPIMGPVPTGWMPRPEPVPKVHYAPDPRDPNYVPLPCCK
jgi:hypothetical protein